MKRIIFLLAVFLSLGIGIFTATYAQDIEAEIDEAETPPFAILELKLKSSKFTEFYPECGEDCLPWTSWHVYKAKVKRVLYGTYAEPKIEFVHLQHASFMHVKNRTVFVEIAEFTNEDTIKDLGTRYFARSFEFPRETVCFRTSMIDALTETDTFDDVEDPWIEDAFDVHEDGNESCFDTQDLRR